MLREEDGPLPRAAAVSPGELVGMLAGSMASVGRSPGIAGRGEGLVGDNRPRPEC